MHVTKNKSRLRDIEGVVATHRTMQRKLESLEMSKGEEMRLEGCVQKIRESTHNSGMI